MPVSQKTLLGLRLKYIEMRAMRLADADAGADADADADAERVEVDERRIRARMNDLAAQFPGALRETDALPMEAIERRIAELDAALAIEGAAAPWMEAVALFHSLTRGALVTKRWLRGRKNVDDALAAQFARDLPTLPFPEDGGDWIAHLASVASPPRGRLLDLVFVRLATQLGIPAGVARALVFEPRVPGSFVQDPAKDS